MNIDNVNAELLLSMKEDVRQAYEELHSKGLNLDLTRGKPSAEQLDFSVDLLSLPGENFTSPSGPDGGPSAVGGRLGAAGG